MTTASLQPASVHELSTLLKAACEKGLAVIPWGSGSHQTMGKPHERADIILHTDQLNRILEHAEGDLITTVESGIRFKDLRAFLSERGQFFPFWEPGCETRSIGGILSTGSPNDLAGRYGRLRDLVLGVSLVQADGTVIKGGGKVVKNVSGYEMPKLFIGAFGTLGVIASVTLRLFPLPQKISILKAIFHTSHKGLAALKSLFLSKLLLTHAALHDAHETIHLFLRIEGGERLVAEQTRQAEAILKACGASEISQALSLADDPATSDVVCFGFVPPSSFRNLESEIEVLSKSLTLTPASIFSMDGKFDVGWSGHLPAGSISCFENFAKRISAIGGWLVFKRVPEPLRRDWPMWGEERPEWELTRRLKTVFDPGNILNPGRFLTNDTRVGS